jgi:ParB family transcriptional regulator, chromosome partitioning protein
VVATPELPTVQVVEIPLKRIKVSTRLRGTDEDAVKDLSESIAGIGLLHPITVSRHGEWFHLLSGMHRLEAFRQLGRETIPATISESDPLIEEIIEEAPIG